MAKRRRYFREWRKHRGLTQDQVVDRLDVLEDPNIPRTKASLSRIENGKQPYTERIVEALADIYNTEPGNLLDVNPGKEGRVIDFVRALSERDQERAIAIIEAMASASNE